MYILSFLNPRGGGGAKSFSFPFGDEWIGTVRYGAARDKLSRGRGEDDAEGVDDDSPRVDASPDLGESVSESKDSEDMVGESKE